MAPKTAEDIEGLGYDWLASDADGHVALFSTVGGGYAPQGFLDDIEAHDEGIEEILAVQPSTMNRLKSALETRHMIAERGVFAFDSDVDGGPYRLVAAPAAPVSVDDLPPSAAQVARGLVLNHLRFAELQQVTPEMLKAHSGNS